MGTKSIECPGCGNTDFPMFTVTEEYTMCPCCHRRLRTKDIIYVDPNSMTLEKLKRNAERSFEVRQYKNARTDWEKAIQLDRTDYESYFGLVRCDMAMQPDSTIHKTEHLEQALVYAPEDVRMEYIRQVKIHNNRIREAKEAREVEKARMAEKKRLEEEKQKAEEEIFSKKITKIVFLFAAICTVILIVLALSIPHVLDERKKGDFYKQLDSGLTVALGENTFDAAAVEVGATVRFGLYDWLVLEIQSGNALLLSKNGVTSGKYHYRYESVTWETCSLHQWLNSEFYDSFSATEQAMIRLTIINDEEDHSRKISGGNDTHDKIFLLSLAEAEKYFGSDAIFHGDRIMGYWLRSIRTNHKRAVIFGGPRGRIIYEKVNYRRLMSPFYDYSYYSVRPAMWITL